MLDFESVGPGFESHSEPFTDLFHGSPELLNPLAALVNSQLVCLLPVGILNHVMFHLQYLFQLFEWQYPGELSVLLTILTNLHLHLHFFQGRGFGHTVPMGFHKFSP